MENTNKKISPEPILENQPEPSGGLNEADIYKLPAKKLTRNKQKIERREFKNRLGDRRSEVRLTADGEPQPDRRRANRIAYAEMYAQFTQSE